MKTPILVLLALTVSLTTIAAPQSGPPSQVQRMVSQLNVTADQKAKLDPILAEDAKLVRALRDSGLSAEDQARKKAEIRKATDEKIKPILTDDQWKKLQDLRAEGGKKGKKK
jgi:Spy/CpxP family protein refolding chaperone